MKTELYNGLKKIGIDVDKAVAGFNQNEGFYLTCLVRFFDMDHIENIKTALTENSQEALEVSRNFSVLAKKLGMTKMSDTINELRGFILSEDKFYEGEVLSKLNKIYEQYRVYVKNHSYMINEK